MAIALDWYPVRPDLYSSGPSKGAFIALSNFPNGGALKPLPLANGQKHFNHWDDRHQSHSLRVALELATGGVFDTAASGETKSLTYNFVWHELRTIEKDPVGGLIWGTRWGAGIRVHLRTKTLATNAKLTLGAVAAQVELGEADSRFEVETFGITDQSFIAELPGPGRLDQAAADTLTKLGDKLHDYTVKQRKAKLVPRPYELLAPPDFFQIPVYNALSFVFAAAQMKKGVSYDQALKTAAKFDNVSPLKVHRLYAKWGAPLNGDAPSKAIVERAAKFLDV